MKKCNHKFQGHKDGVTCLLCGLKMSGREYVEYCTAKELAAQGDADCKQFLSDVENGEYLTEADLPRVTTDTINAKKRKSNTNRATKDKKEDASNE